MPQDAVKILPLFINTDKSYENISADESPFMKGLSWNINANPEQGIGTNNPSGEGQNMYALTPARSNELVEGIELPAQGWNRNLGNYESKTTKELYVFNYNSLLNHGIYVVDGNTGLVRTVVIDPKLAFSDDPEGAIDDIRVSLRYVKDKDGNITEKHLVWTDGKKWHGWVNVLAAIGSNGFDASLYPYWKLMPPHFDREELLEWAVRPPMIKPVVSVIANTAADTGKISRLADQAIRFAIAYQNTDGRTTTLSPYSLPLTVKSEDYLNSPDVLPKNAKVVLPAGSPLTEKILIFVQKAGSKNSVDSLSVWGDWILYDTIEKFDTAPVGNYWTRQNAWASYSYNDQLNTIEYVFDNSKVGRQVSQQDMMMLQTAMPQVSQAMTDVDDAVILCNNRYGYGNFSKDLLSKISAVVKEKTSTVCNTELVEVTIYGYVGMTDATFEYISQIGFFLGDDKTVRFGGMRPAASASGGVNIDPNESKFFGLDLADKKGFRIYAKGTPYYADCEWIKVNTDNSIDVMPDEIDFLNNDTLEALQAALQAGSYFAMRWKLKVPKGRYNIAVGRHSVSSQGDYRNTSTYVYGIANSRQKSSTPRRSALGNYSLITIKPNAISTWSKEMEIDCTGGDVDLWGNNADMFYIYCPYNHYLRGNGNFVFIEGYFQESSDSPIPVELFPYQMTGNDADDWGKYTDKNGFYFAHTKAREAANTNIEFVAKVNCGYPKIFTVPSSQGGIGWKKNKIAYLSSNNNNVVGDCNRIVYTGRITDLTGLNGYSNIAVSMKDGPTVYTRNDGTFTMIVHNGQNTLRTSNVYVNAAGNYVLTMENCGFLPVTNFSESLIPCAICTVRNYPIPLNLRVVVQNNSQTSVKQGGKYNVGIVGADLAGRIMNVNIVDEPEVSTFLQRDNINATYFQLLIAGALNILSENPDIKWVSPYVSKNVVLKRYDQWVGDSIEYLDNNGNIISDPATAAFVRIRIDSLYEANVRSNFSLLANYQFVKGDRLRIYDDGDGNLFDVATFGNPIDIQVLGTSYNQAAINAGLLLPQANTVLPSTAPDGDTNIGIIVQYDQRLDKLLDKTGFWIELLTPTQESDTIPFFEVAGFYPVINGEIANFTGFSNGQPVYTFPTTIDIDFWDTYFLQRNIAGKYFNHPFESQNVTDNWGANITSGGRINVEDKEAKQYWLGGDVIRSDSFYKRGRINGLATFRDENRKNYGIFPFGEIVAAHTKRNMIAFNCVNDWFTVDYNMPYTRVSNGQLVVTNLDDNLSQPHQKTGDIFGVEKKDIKTIVVDEDLFFWYDRKNAAFVKCNYGSALDVTDKIGENERGGLESYISAKTSFINDWDQAHEQKDRFDVVAGIDQKRGNVYLTFRPRRDNSNDARTYGSGRRWLDQSHQETFVYSIQYNGWLPCACFTPESYARLHGNWANVEFISFGAGKMYIHNNSANDSFLNYYGVQYEPVLFGVVNKSPDKVKILGSISQVINGSYLYSDFIFDTQKNSFSYIPANRWKQKEKIFYADVLRNMVSYPPVDPEQLFRSMLFDGKRMFAIYAVVRLVQQKQELGKYFQLSEVKFLFTNSFTTKP